MSGNTYVTAVYASPPLNLRLSPGERGKEKKVPVAFQRRLARAQCHVPYLEGPVLGCRHDGVAFGRKLDATDVLAAIFSNVRFLVNCSTPLPR